MTLEEAREAAKDAAEHSVANSKISADGFVVDSCGGAMLVVYKPSYKLRKTLTEMDEIRPGYKGAWSISRFSGGIPSAGGQSYSVHKAAYDAACEVFKKNFPGEGDFYCHAYVD